jgi:predicted DsbA family dithiol-disulfide isomerase
VDECVELHRALSKAEVEFQQKLDALKDFELSLLMPNVIIDFSKTLDTCETLKAEERAAHERLNEARVAYEQCPRRR